ncbi:unnamed protein product, partial [Phaeothamnion confervicola]
AGTTTSAVASTTSTPAPTTPSVVPSSPPRVIVANAANTDGVAGAFSVVLLNETKYVVVDAVNARSTLEQSVVYFGPGFDDVAAALADRLGGADIAPMPESLPIRQTRPIPVTAGEVDVLVMIGTDHADLLATTDGN